MTLVIVSIGSEGLPDGQSIYCSYISNVRWSGLPRIPRARWSYHRIVKSWRQFRSGRCSMIELDWTITENYGRTLVDMLNWSAEFLVINLGSDVVVMPLFLCLVDVVQVSAATVARTLNSTGGYTDCASS